jgi:hypothetical protein
VKLATTGAWSELGALRCALGSLLIDGNGCSEQGTQASVIGRILVEMLNADPQIAERVAVRLEELRGS